MKKLAFTLTTLFLLLTTFVACNKEEENPGIPFTKFSLSGTSCEWIRMELREEDLPLPISELIIINSDEELRNHIACVVTDGEYTLPVIDFSRYTLLLARGKTGAIQRMHIALHQLSPQNYVMNVALYTPFFIGSPKYWHVAIIINKLEKGDSVKLNIIETP